MQPLMVNSTQMSVNTIQSQLCLLASLQEQWREKRTLTEDQEADNQKQCSSGMAVICMQGQIEEEGRETTECKTHHEPTSVPGNDRAPLQNE